MYEFKEYQSLELIQWCECKSVAKLTGTLASIVKEELLSIIADMDDGIYNSSEDYTSDRETIEYIIDQLESLDCFNEEDITQLLINIQAGIQLLWKYHASYFVMYKLEVGSIKILLKTKKE